MPAMGGLEVCRKLREAGRQVPVIVLSGKKKKEIDKVLGLELGGDDYMTKPFGTDEFIARVHAVLRRSRPEVPEIEDLAFGDVVIDFRKKIASKAGNGPSPDRPGVQPAPAPGRLRGPGRLPGDHPQQGLGIREISDDADDRHVHVQPAAQDRGRPVRAEAPGHGAVAGLQVPALTDLLLVLFPAQRAAPLGSRMTAIWSMRSCTWFRVGVSDAPSTLVRSRSRRALSSDRIAPRVSSPERAGAETAPARGRRRIQARSEQGDKSPLEIAAVRVDAARPRP